jgi:hypothetical protein
MVVAILFVSVSFTSLSEVFVFFPSLYNYQFVVSCVYECVLSMSEVAIALELGFRPWLFLVLMLQSSKLKALLGQCVL